MSVKNKFEPGHYSLLRLAEQGAIPNGPLNLRPDLGNGGDIVHDLNARVLSLFQMSQTCHPSRLSGMNDQLTLIANHYRSAAGSTAPPAARPPAMPTAATSPASAPTQAAKRVQLSQLEARIAQLRLAALTAITTPPATSPRQAADRNMSAALAEVERLQREEDKRTAAAIRAGTWFRNHDADEEPLPPPAANRPAQSGIKAALKDINAKENAGIIASLKKRFGTTTQGE